MQEKVGYSYPSLGDGEIRLIRFLQDNGDDNRTAANLRVFSIDNHIPTYHALSYAWRSDNASLSNNHSIKITDQFLPILDSIQAFLKALKARDTLCDGTWWWIDSICIDQGNLEERSQQVRLMQQIYRRAQNCIVWLGNSSDDSDDALNLIRDLSKVDLYCHDQTGLRQMLEIKFRDHHKQWAALTKWFMRKWWTRIWTVQEFVISRSVALWCGTQSISRTLVCRALIAADKCPWSGFNQTVAFRYGFNRGRLWELYKASNSRPGGTEVTFSLAALAAYFSISDATDDRDRLYGLRALSTDASLLDVSYEHDIQEVYLRYAQAFITHHKSLDIICFSSVYTSRLPPDTDPPMPSWVPDWRRHMGSLVTPLMVSQGCKSHIGNMRPAPFRASKEGEQTIEYSASGNMEIDCTFRGRVLRARGTLIDSIDGLGGSNNSPMVQTSSQANFPTTRKSKPVSSPAQTLRDICKAITLDRGNRYLQNVMPDSFFRDFVRLCTLGLTDSLDPKANDFQAWFERTRLLQIGNCTFQEILHAAMEELGDNFINDESLPPPSQADFIHDTFFGRFTDTIMWLSMRLMISRDGHIGMVPEHARKDDLLCILYGCSVPVVLRKSVGADMEGFTVVGECFIDG